MLALSNRAIQGLFWLPLNAFALFDTRTVVHKGVWWPESLPGIAGVSVDGVITTVSVGETTINYVIINACGADTATKRINIYEVPVAGIITGPDTICKGAVFTLSDTTASGIWSSSNVIVATIDSQLGFTYAATQGNTTISYAIEPNAGGCSDTITFMITVLSQPTFIINSIISPVTCNNKNNGSIYISIGGSTPQFQYVWSNGVTTLSATDLYSGTYILTVTDPATICATIDTFHIIPLDSLILTPIVKNDFCDAGTGSVTIDITGGAIPYSYQWSNNKSIEKITNLVQGVYSVTITDSNGCSISTTAIVGNDSCSDIVIHNAITPNGDGINGATRSNRRRTGAILTTSLYRFLTNGATWSIQKLTTTMIGAVKVTEVWCPIAFNYLSGKAQRTKH